MCIEKKKILLVCFLLPLRKIKMSDTCSLFPLFGDPWPSCLLPFHRVQDELFCCGIISFGLKEKTFYGIKMQECRKEVCPFLLLESPRPLSPPWGPWTSINLRIDSPVQFSFSRSVVSESLWLPGLYHARLPWPSPTPRVYSNLSRWCHPAISSSVVPLSSCLQSFPASGSFPMSQFFASGGQRIGVSASASFLPMNIQDWLSLGWTGWISLQSKGLSRVFSNTTGQKHQFFGAQLSL